MYDMFHKGGPLMWPLLACSILALTVILERALWSWRQRRLQSPQQLRHILELTQQGQLEQALSQAQLCPDPAAAVLVSGLTHHELGLSQSMQNAAQARIEQMKRGLATLDTLITIAPLLGILGTVTGIISSFSMLSESGIPDPKAVSAGIGEALITTATGLIIAIPTLVVFNYFVTQVQRATRELEQLATDMELAYQRCLSRGGKSLLPQEAKP